MHCEEVKKQLLESRSHGKPIEDAAVAAHLAECAECRADKEALVALARRLESWREEPVPPWNRAAVGPVPRTHAGWPTWAALAACALLALAAILRLELTRNGDGWRLAFAPSATVQPNPEVWQAHIDETLERLHGETELRLQEMLANQRKLEDTRLKQWALELTRYTRGERTEAMQAMMDKLQQQRLEDLSIMESQIHNIIDAQNNQGSTLLQLASYVNRIPEYK